MTFTDIPYISQLELVKAHTERVYQEAFMPYPVAFRAALPRPPELDSSEDYDRRFGFREE